MPQYHPTGFHRSIDRGGVRRRGEKHKLHAGAKWVQARPRWIGLGVKGGSSEEEGRDPIQAEVHHFIIVVVGTTYVWHVRQRCGEWNLKMRVSEI